MYLSHLIGRQSMIAFFHIDIPYGSNSTSLPDIIGQSHPAVDLTMIATCICNGPGSVNQCSTELSLVFETCKVSLDTGFTLPNEPSYVIDL